MTRRDDEKPVITYTYAQGKQSEPRFFRLFFAVSSARPPAVRVISAEVVTLSWDPGPVPFRDLEDRLFVRPVASHTGIVLPGCINVGRSVPGRRNPQRYRAPHENLQDALRRDSRQPVPLCWRVRRRHTYVQLQTA
jgi:hypothetical protein